MLLKYFLPIAIFIRCAPGWSGPACDCKVYHFKTDILILILNISSSSYIEPGGWEQLRGPGYWPHLRWARPVRLWGALAFYISHLTSSLINCSEYPILQWLCIIFIIWLFEGLQVLGRRLLRAALLRLSSLPGSVWELEVDLLSIGHHLNWLDVHLDNICIDQFHPDLREI